MKKFAETLLHGVGLVLTILGLLLMAYVGAMVLLVWGEGILGRFMGMCLLTITIGGALISAVMLSDVPPERLPFIRLAYASREDADG